MNKTTMTEKENLEMINLRNRVRSQRQEIKRLQAENEALKKAASLLQQGERHKGKDAETNISQAETDCKGEQ